DVDLFDVDLFDVDLFDVDLFDVDLFDVDLFDVDLFDVDLFDIIFVVIDLISIRFLLGCNMSNETKQEIEKQMLAHQFNEVQEQLQKISEQLSEVESLKEAISEFSKLKKQQELLVPLASGIFFNVSLLEEKVLRINVGAGVLVEKTPEQALELIGEQHVALAKLREDVQQQFETLLNAVRHFEE
ncbi:MAG: prefoldin subunit alpha, partial [Candidatus Woesearchaeota archaeon]